MPNTFFTRKRATIKLILLVFGLFVLFFPTTYLLAGANVSQKEATQTILNVPLVVKNQTGIGFLEEPKIEATIMTVTEPVKVSFLVDSGSAISSLPFEFSNQLGYKLENLKRLAFRGYGNTTSFAYEGEMKIKIVNEEIQLPVVFTENSGTTPILGRRGFFENYTILFNHKQKSIEVRK